MQMELHRKNVTNRLEDTMSKYDDIINLPHHVSKDRIPMSMENRAAQFAPFAALTGHNEALEETARLTTPKKLLSDDEMASLTRKLTRVIEQVPGLEEYTFMYFVPDVQKEGGKYVSITDTVKKIRRGDKNNHVIGRESASD